MPRLIWVLAGRTAILLVLPWRGSIIIEDQFKDFPPLIFLVKAFINYRILSVAPIIKTQYSGRGEHNKWYPSKISYSATENSELWKYVGGLMLKGEAFREMKYVMRKQNLFQIQNIIFLSTGKVKGIVAMKLIQPIRWMRSLAIEPPHDKTNKMICVSSEDSNQPGHPPSLIICCPHEESLGPWLSTERTAKTLTRLGSCPGWSESSLGAQVILFVLSCCGSNRVGVAQI